MIKIKYSDGKIINALYITKEVYNILNGTTQQTSTRIHYEEVHVENNSSIELALEKLEDVILIKLLQANVNYDVDTYFTNEEKNMLINYWIDLWVERETALNYNDEHNTVVSDTNT